MTKNTKGSNRLPIAFATVVLLVTLWLVAGAGLEGLAVLAIAAVAVAVLLLPTLFDASEDPEEPSCPS